MSAERFDFPTPWFESGGAYRPHRGEFLLFGVVISRFVPANHQLAIDWNGFALDVESLAVFVRKGDAYAHPSRLFLIVLVREILDDEDVVAIDFLRLC